MKQTKIRKKRPILIRRGTKLGSLSNPSFYRSNRDYICEGIRVLTAENTP